MELYRKYRPNTFSDVFGQREAVGVLRGWLKNNNVPHAILLEGASGCGKTTCARILANELGAVGHLNYKEINVAEDNGVEMVTALGEDVGRNLTGGKRVWVLDEVASATKQAQSSLLKKLEEAPDYAYFILCTTDPQKLLPTIQNRCSRIVIKPLSADALRSALLRVVQGEGREVPEEVIDNIILAADGSGRKALVQLEQCLAATRVENMLALIGSSQAFEGTIRDLCLILTGSKRATWKETAKLFDGLEDDPERIRRAILGWISSAMIKGWSKLSPMSLAALLRIFQFNTFDSGKPQLLLMVYDAWNLFQKNH